MYIGQAEIVLKRVVGAGEAGPETNISALLVGKDKSLDDLGGWVTDNDVAANDVVAGSVKEQDSVSVASDIVSLDQVFAAATLEANTKVNVPVCVVDAAISVECRLVHPVLIAVH